MDTKRITTVAVVLLVAAFVHAPLLGAGDVDGSPECAMRPRVFGSDDRSGDDLHGR